MNCRQIKDYYFGFADLTISELGSGAPAFFDGMSLLITCLDSTTQISQLSKWMKMLDDRGYMVEQTNNGIWIPANETMRLLNEGLTFYGFDEVYLFKSKPTIQGVKCGVFTTDGYNFAEDVPSNFIDSFLTMGATRYLSDGCGLNFACESLAIFQYVEVLVNTNRENRMSKT